MCVLNKCRKSTVDYSNIVNRINLFISFHVYKQYIFYLIFIYFFFLSLSYEKKNRVLARRITHINYDRMREIYMHASGSTALLEARIRHGLIEARRKRERERDDKTKRHSWECEESISD